MSKDDPSKEKLFKRFKSGDSVALGDLLEEERASLYDYLMRMTGQVSRSQETTAEVYSSLSEDMFETLDTLTELRLCLYETARRFNGDIWNADTSKLVNAAFAGPEGGDEGRGKVPRAGQQLLDRALRSLGGPQREVVWLHALGGFQLGDCARIMGLPEEEVDTLYLRGAGAIDAEAEEAYGPANKALRYLPQHPLPPPSSNATVNLSMVMAGIKTKPVGLWSPVRIGLLVVVLVVLAAWYLAPPGSVKSLLAPLLSKVGETPKS